MDCVGADMSVPIPTRGAGPLRLGRGHTSRIKPYQDSKVSRHQLSLYSIESTVGPVRQPPTATAAGAGAGAATAPAAEPEPFPLSAEGAEVASASAPVPAAGARLAAVAASLGGNPSLFRRGGEGGEWRLLRAGHTIQLRPGDAVALSGTRPRRAAAGSSRAEQTTGLEPRHVFELRRRAAVVGGGCGGAALPAATEAAGGDGASGAAVVNDRASRGALSGALATAARLAKPVVGTRLRLGCPGLSGGAGAPAMVGVRFVPRGVRSRPRLRRSEAQGSRTGAGAAWEAHTTGFGSRMLYKMGYMAGHGLGKDGRGRTSPVPVVVLPPRTSLDFCSAHCGSGPVHTGGGTTPGAEEPIPRHLPPPPTAVEKRKLLQKHAGGQLLAMQAKISSLEQQLKTEKSQTTLVAIAAQLQRLRHDEARALTRRAQDPARKKLKAVF